MNTKKTRLGLKHGCVSQAVCVKHVAIGPLWHQVFVTPPRVQRSGLSSSDSWELRGKRGTVLDFVMLPLETCRNRYVGPLTSLCSRKREEKEKKSLSGSLMESETPLQHKLRSPSYIYIFFFPPSERTKPSVSPLPRFDISLCILATFGSEQPTKSFHRATIELKPLSIAFSLFDPPPRVLGFFCFLHSSFYAPWNGFRINAWFWFELIRKRL